MKFKPVETRLRNGQSLIIRQCELSDSAELIKTIKNYLGTTEFIPLTTNGFSPKPQEHLQLIESFQNQVNSILLVAIVDDKIIGNIDLTGNQRAAMKHTGMIGMGILNEWRNLGIGTIFMDNLIKWATDNDVLKQLWLQVYGSNLAAIKLYEKFQFVKTGVQKNFFKLNSGFYADNITMNLILPEKF